MLSTSLFGTQKDWKVFPTDVGMLRCYSWKTNRTFRHKVCSNHFAQGYRNPQCRTPALYMKSNDSEGKFQRPAPKIRRMEYYYTKRPEKGRKVKTVRWMMTFHLRNRGYYMALRRHEISLRNISRVHTRLSECYFRMWGYHVFARKLTWYFTGVYIIKFLLMMV